MSERFVPELHDLGKLIQAGLSVPATDGKALNRHGADAFARVDWTALGIAEPATQTWQAVRHHHDPDYYALPDADATDLEARIQVFLTILADHLAATTGRALGEELGKIKVAGDAVYRLWNPQYAQQLAAAPVPIADAASLRLALERVADGSHTWADYQSWYGDNLRICAEDKDAARRVTSLLSHVELTGKFLILTFSVVTRFAP